MSWMPVKTQGQIANFSFLKFFSEGLRRELLAYCHNLQFSGGRMCATRNINFSSGGIGILYIQVKMHKAQCKRKHVCCKLTALSI